MYFYLLYLLIVLTPFVSGGLVVSLKGYEHIIEDNQLGLYNSSDKVTILTAGNFKDLIHQKNRSILVEFYNSYCGHCKRFAPKYKDLALKLYSWREILCISAIDCAIEENNEICREYEVMAYPSLRYFGPNYLQNNVSYGRPIETQDLEEIRTELSKLIANENRTANMLHWPNFQVLNDTDADHMFSNSDPRTEIVVLIYEPEKLTVGIETALQFQLWPNLSIRRINNLDFVKKIFKSDSKILTIDRHGNIKYYERNLDKLADYFEAVEEIIKSHNFSEKQSHTEELHIESTILENEKKKAQYHEIMREVKRNKHTVYQADLEMALRTILFNEIPKVSNISGQHLLTLKQFLLVIKRYNPLKRNGQLFLNNLYQFVVQHNEKITGKEFEDEVTRLTIEFQPIFVATRYIGCISSKPTLRGFTCSLWHLFHYLTVQAAQSADNEDPLEILQTMHGYIKYFFGCTDCSKHFLTLAAQKNIWSVSTKNNSILWLWAAHNEVNQRLARDITEDSEFPKIQFPSQLSCPKCSQHSQNAAKNSNISWHKSEVLKFLQDIYKSHKINLYGIQNEEPSHTDHENMRHKRMVANILSDVDMRMGMLLYGFCIVMMVVAFKLFAYKKYRKKSYVHELLGKV